MYVCVCVCVYVLLVYTVYYLQLFTNCVSAHAATISAQEHAKAVLEAQRVRVSAYIYI